MSVNHPIGQSGLRISRDPRTRRFTRQLRIKTRLTRKGFQLFAGTKGASPSTRGAGDYSIDDDRHFQDSIPARLKVTGSAKSLTSPYSASHPVSPVTGRDIGGSSVASDFPSDCPPESSFHSTSCICCHKAAKGKLRPIPPLHHHVVRSRAIESVIHRGR